jgi:hypothetical protein
MFSAIIARQLLQLYIAGDVPFRRQLGWPGHSVKMDEIVLVPAAFILLRNRINKEKKKKKRTLWMRPFLSRHSNSETVTREVLLDSYLFKNFTKMSTSEVTVFVKRY